MQKLDKQKLVVQITGELLLKLGITPEEGVEYLENKMAIDMSPVHVKAHQLLKQSVVASS